ncbi:MAG: hypothetical protein RLZZ597_2162 [Cyanobacteriota bacterium]|jgi:hypothetical protein
MIDLFLPQSTRRSEASANRLILNLPCLPPIAADDETTPLGFIGLGTGGFQFRFDVPRNQIAS